MDLKVIFLICGLVSELSYGNTLYHIPKVQLQILSKGFSLSIPDETGLKKVAFNINRNHRFKGFEQGEISIQVYEPTNGLWSYSGSLQLLDADILYVWVSVQHNQLIYRSIADEILVSAVKINEKKSEDLLKKIVDDSVTKMNSIEQDTRKCEPSLTRVQNQQFCKGQLIFEENFDSHLNLTRWKQEVRLALDLGDGEFVLYDSNAKVIDGNLLITPLIWNNDQPLTDIRRGAYLDLGIRCTGHQDRAKECKRQPDGLSNNVLPPVITSRINTKNSFNFKYGRIDIRAKVPQGDWLFPLLLLEPTYNYYGLKSYISGQIRIAYVRGNPNLYSIDNEHIGGNTLFGGALFSTNPDLRERSMVKMKGKNHFGFNFHIYTLVWNNESLLLQVDDQKYGEILGGFSQLYATDYEKSSAWLTGNLMSPLDQEFFITLGLAVGGHGDFPENILTYNKSKPWNNTSPKAAFTFWQDRENWKKTWAKPSLEVDYVKVFAV